MDAEHLNDCCPTALRIAMWSDKYPPYGKRDLGLPIRSGCE